MPQRITSARTTTAATQALTRIAEGLRIARARTGLSEQQVVDLLARQGFEMTVATLRRWETTGRLHVDAAARLADAYGTTIDGLVGRRAFRGRHPLDDLPPTPRNSW